MAVGMGVSLSRAWEAWDSSHADAGERALRFLRAERNRALIRAEQFTPDQGGLRAAIRLAEPDRVSLRQTRPGSI